jgi:hypothetical protein
VLAYPTEELLFVNELAGESVPAIEAFVIDNCDTNAAYEATEGVLAESGDTLTLERVYVAADACGNTTVFTQVITVVQAFEGCTDLEACNYSDESNVDDGSCTYAEEGLDCEGNCLSDVDGDGYCDPEVTGCTDEAACNYVELATEDDGSCEYCSCLGEEQAGYGLLLEVHAEHTEGELSGMTTYRMYITTPNTNDIISAIYGDNDSPLEIATTTSFYQHPFGSSLGTNNNPLLYSGFPELEFDSWLTMGLDTPPGPGEVAPSTIGDLNNGWVSNFEAGMNIVIEDSIGGAMFITNDPGTTNIVSGEEQRILIGQFTTDGDMSGVINAQMFTEGVTEPADRVTLDFDGVGLHVGGGDVVCGCMDELACNYDATANNDDGSCEYESCLGCADPEACNYDGATIDDGTCEYPDFPCVACDGSCLSDVDGDGVCDCLEFPGCTDPEACNYDPIYTDDAGNCYYAEEFYDCFGNCINDGDGDGTCDELEVLGCTDPEFCDYNPDATEDDGSCGSNNQINDVCSGSLELTCGQSIVANNEECASVDDIEGCADADVNSPTAGLWFSFVGTGQEVTVSTCYPGTNIDTYLSVYEGTCGDLTCVAGNDDQSEPFYDDLCPVFTFASTVVMATEEGVEYFVLVSGVLDDVGDFEVGLSCVVAGCTDSTACNYDELSTLDDGSCTYPELEYLDCEGNCLNDMDEDGICDEEEVLGCTDPLASNYNDLATDDNGICFYCDLDLTTTLIQGVTCEGDANGIVSLELLNVELPDSIEIFLNGMPQDTTVFEGLSAGAYTVEVTQGADCSALINFNVAEGLVLEVQTDVTDVLCFGASSGTVTATATNGAAPYEYVLDGPTAIVNDNGIFADLPAGVYVLFVSDANGCTGSSEVTVSQPDELLVEATVVNPEELGTGSIELTVTGGTEPYQFSWTSTGDFTSDLEDIDGLEAPQSYTVVVTDANGCETVGGPYEVDDVYSVHSLNSVPFSVYPNPARDVVQLEMEEVTSDAVMTIYDASGRVMWSRSAERWVGRFSVDVSSWASGTYHIQVATSRAVGHAPLVVQH